ncbi:gastrokine-1-like [Elgaria multicarinata webbii]|uniref:gastrokine-1-like n=1 Tax=Elgaria multicarinata webbii TaxID=159646 RepID=UPI002FCCBD8B
MENVNQVNQGNVGGRSHQSVNIDNKRKVVNIDNNNGWNSWNTIWDYQTGFMATRIMSKKSCVVVKMNKAVIPDITTLPQAIREKQQDPTKGPARKDIAYTVSPKRITNLSPYGKNIEALCKGIPSYAAYEVKRPSFPFYGGDCIEANILWIVGISLCGEAYGY